MQGDPEQVYAGLMAMGAIFFVILALVSVVVLAIWIALLYFLMTCFQRVPREHRKQEPGLVWLLLIPCFNYVWNFFVFPRLAQSYRSYFESVGRTDVGDCGEMLGMMFSIMVAASGGLALVSWIPIIGLISMLNCLIGPASLVVLIMFLVKANGLKQQIPPEASGG
jgi:hypothetical protein